MKPGVPINMTDVFERQRAETKAILGARVALVNAIRDVLSKPGVQCVTAVGWTPEWNDGDECLHRQYVMVNHNQRDYCTVLLSDGVPASYTDIDYERGRPDWPWDALDAAIDMPKVPETASEVNKFLEAALGTNWCLYADDTGVYIGPHEPGY